MVVSTLHNEKKPGMESQKLKFGMDRILSEDMSSKRKPSKAVEEVESVPAPPCAGCLTSLYRCCRTSPFPTTTYYKSVIHAPQPLRPYTNGLVKTESQAPSSQQGTASSGGNQQRRKRSWSRAVFSNLQRKGLEKRFQLQKYITKPDRRQLAATLGLSDAQVKVWFQNRRMKWRHTKETSRQSYTKSDIGENGNHVTGDTMQTHASESDSGSDIDVQTVEC